MSKWNYAEWVSVIREQVRPNYAPIDPALLQPYTHKTSAIKVIDISHRPGTFEAWVQRLQTMPNVAVLVALTPESEAFVFRYNYERYIQDSRPAYLIVFNDVIVGSANGNSLFSKRHAPTPERFADILDAHLGRVYRVCCVCLEEKARNVRSCGRCTKSVCERCSDQWMHEKGAAVSCPMCRLAPAKVGV